MTGDVAVPLAFELDGRRLDCRVLRARRRTYALRVSADGVLELRVPLRLPAHLLPDILHRHRRWIAGQLERRARRATAAPDFGHGSPQRYMGRSYPLQLAAGPAHVRLLDECLQVSVPAPDHAPTVSGALDGWYRRQAQALLPPRLASLASTLPWLSGRSLPPPRVVRLRARWGSCAADGRITLNLGLVLLEQPLIDYVLLHELCHLREMNHGPRFYVLLAAALPDHRERQAALRQERPWRPLPA
ncbi:MAG: M48 family metallopeptidase [Immundisolibacter sp.]|uniref:M48 family metallopeptidase n=1 Tax=Immundisolibacter sp. TaxID=1934948 RepID=UPI0019C11916|nr:SprT family zinc-dependent metalloprotease [Immundisolibacter sp.]MBC7162427.1 M48 family metallopeptidase [Immundisolibacter sp.]